MKRQDQKRQGLPQFLLQDGTMLKFMPGDSWVVGRATPTGTVVDIDLTPHGGAENGVSRQHVCIRWEEERFTIEDLQSHNETVLNRARLLAGQPYPLADGDQLALGAMRLTFVINVAAKTA